MALLTRKPAACSLDKFLQPSTLVSGRHDGRGAADNSANYQHLSLSAFAARPRLLGYYRVCGPPLPCLLFTLLLLSISAMGARLRSHRVWLHKYGQPEVISPAAFCDMRGITIVVPVPDDVSAVDVGPASSYQLSLGSLLSRHTMELGARGRDCAAQFIPGFFTGAASASAANVSDTINAGEGGSVTHIWLAGNEIKGRGSLAGPRGDGAGISAWLARAVHSGCQGHTIDAGDIIIHSNRLTFGWAGTNGLPLGERGNRHQPHRQHHTADSLFRSLVSGGRGVDPSKFNVLMTCSCEASTGECSASARWEHEVLQVDEQSQDLVGGFSVSSAAIVGSKREVEILPDNDT